MNLEKIFVDTNFVHASGTEEELKVAQYLKERCEELGVEAELESFSVPMAAMHSSKLLADGKEIPCKGLYCCGSGSVTGELYYMPSTDPLSIRKAKDKIVLLDTQGAGYFTYQDLVKAGAKGIIFQYGNIHYDHQDIDQRDLRKAIVKDAEKLLCVMVHSSSAIELVKNHVQEVTIEIEQDEYEGQSHNVIATIPGEYDEYVVLSAHYDSTSLSHGAYDNMSGCAGLLGVMEALKDQKHRYGLKFIFCGSEERGLLGSKDYVIRHEAELEKIVLDINLDMIGSIMGKFIGRISAEEKLANYISYLGYECDFPIETKCGVYSSDSTPFADHGVPALSFARIASGNVAPIHCRYDLMDVMSMEQLEKDIAFIAAFTRRMVDAKQCPVKREIPESVKKDLDLYLFRKRRD